MENKRYKKIYISGPITKDPDYKKHFEYAECVLSMAGLIPVNPARNHLEGNPTWKDFMIVDIKQLVECDGVYMLKGWRKSKGARLERLIAKSLD